MAAKKVTKPKADKPGPSKDLQKMEKQMKAALEKSKVTLEQEKAVLKQLMVQMEAADASGITGQNAAPKVVQSKDVPKLIILKDNEHMIGFVRCFAHNDLPIPYESGLSDHAIFCMCLHRLVFVTIPLEGSQTITKMEFMPFTNLSDETVTLFPAEQITAIKKPNVATNNKFCEKLMYDSFEQKHPDLFKLLNADMADDHIPDGSREKVEQRKEEFEKFVQSVTHPTAKIVEGEVEIKTGKQAGKKVDKELLHKEHRLSNYFFDGARKIGPISQDGVNDN